MADTNNRMSDKSPNQTMQHEQAKASVSGQQRQPEQGQAGGDRQREQSELDRNRQEKSAIGGGQSSSQTGEPGRARDELGQNRSETESR
jgi:hypothetical protein